MRLQSLPGIMILALLTTTCAASNDATPGPATDASITVAVKARLLAAAFTPALHIHVDTKDRVVTLSGKVTRRALKEEAVRVASRVGGVRSVIDELDIRQNF